MEQKPCLFASTLDQGKLKMPRWSSMLLYIRGVSCVYIFLSFVLNRHYVSTLEGDKISMLIRKYPYKHLRSED